MFEFPGTASRPGKALGDVVPSGWTRAWISHGTADRVLPIDRCSRRVVPQLRGLGIEVTYRVFDGGHAVPGAIVRDAWAWLQAA